MSAEIISIQMLILVSDMDVLEPSQNKLSPVGPQVIVKILLPGKMIYTVNTWKNQLHARGSEISHEPEGV